MKRSLFIAWLLPTATSAALAGYEAPDPAYLPGSYYNSVTATDSAGLRSQLSTVVNTGFVSLSYDSIRSAFVNLDADPNDSGNILLMYDRQSVSGTWDGGVTYNREHVWAKSRLSSTAAQSDYFNLRPADPNTNSSHGNENYASGSSSGSSALVTVGGTQYWFPGDIDKGDVARGMFYMATKWNLSIVNGNPAASNNTIGDLTSLLHWNYQDGVDNFERHRNQVIYTSYQHDRNPYIDHPEYVWAVFGGGNNNSQISVATPAANGTSSADINLGRIIKGSAIGAASINISKSGSNPTTYNIATSGEATTAAAGVGQAFDYGTQSRTIPVTLSSSTASAGRKSGTITITNTDLTSSGTGTGSADGADSAFVHVDVLDHASPSLSPSTIVRSLTVDFGKLAQGGVSPLKTISICNIESTAGYTAGLDLDAVQTLGDSSAFSSSVSSFANLTAGDLRNFTAQLNTSTLGNFSETLTLSFSDENVTGATVLAPATITLTGEIVAAPEPAALMLIALGSLMGLRRPRRKA